MPLWRSAVHPHTPPYALAVPRRQVYLYALTVFLPCALLVALGARMLVEERELHARAPGHPVLPLAFYASALLAALGIVLLGAYFLWRDVQREARLAHMRSQFVASVSHELKTPLTSVRIFAETLRDRSFIEPRVRLEYLDTIAREADRLTRLLDNVLEFSRVERGERRYHFSLQQLPAIVGRALVALRFPLEQQGFSVHFHCEDHFAAVRCDPDAIEQAVLNLMSNAMKYSAGDHRIEVAIARRGGELALSVRDYGIGIAPDHRTHIFDRFYRAPTVENSSISGTGLGLTLVQHIIQSHGGRVGLETAIGRGSTFTLFLPLPSAAAEPATMDVGRTPVPSSA